MKISYFIQMLQHEESLGLVAVKFQVTSYSCGAAAIRNALRVFGVHVSERSIWRAASITKNGTELAERSIVDGIRHFGLSASSFTGNNRRHAWEWLRGCLVDGKPVILCVDEWGHWVCCIGLIGDRVVVFDSSNTIVNRGENGVSVLPYKRLLRRWRCRKSGGVLSAVAVG